MQKSGAKIGNGGAFREHDTCTQCCRHECATKEFISWCFPRLNLYFCVAWQQLNSKCRVCNKTMNVPPFQNLYPDLLVHSAMHRTLKYRIVPYLSTKCCVTFWPGTLFVAYIAKCSVRCHKSINIEYKQSNGRKFELCFCNYIYQKEKVKKQLFGH